MCLKKSVCSSPNEIIPQNVQVIQSRESVKNKYLEPPKQASPSEIIYAIKQKTTANPKINYQCFPHSSASEKYHFLGDYYEPKVPEPICMELPTALYIIIPVLPHPTPEKQAHIFYLPPPFYTQRDIE